eukprot:CFRG0485T1
MLSASDSEQLAIPPRGLTDSTDGQVPLKFNTNFSNESLQLFSFPEEMLESLHKGSKFFIKGEREDEAVLCTSDETFLMRSADTSNSLLIFERNVMTQDQYTSERNSMGMADIHTVKEKHVNMDKTRNMDTDTEAPVIPIVPTETMIVHSIAKTCFELRKTLPRVERLPILLGECPYSGEDDDEERSRQRKYTYAQILEKVQSSEAEINAAIASILCIEHNGYLRILDKYYSHKVIDLLLSVVESLDISYETVEFGVCVSELINNGYNIPNSVLRVCLRSLVDHDAEIDDEIFVQDNSKVKDVYRLDDDKIVRFRANQILTAVGRPMDYDEFMSAWNHTLPSALKVNEKLLSGLALVQEGALMKTISKLDADDLSFDAQQRFNALFEQQDEWELEAILPYIRPLCAPGEQPVMLLSKFARSSTNSVTGIKMYNSRYGMKR